jgi:hypothetical protein
MQKAFNTGEARGQDLALLTDRVRLYEGKPQLYGTQVKNVNGKFIFAPIEDEPNVDKRRALYGLPPLSEYLETLNEFYRMKNK